MKLRRIVRFLPGVLWLGCVMLAVGCKTAGGHSATSAFFPIGLYDVPQGDLEMVREAGFNVVTATPGAEYLEAAKRNGLKVLAYAEASRALTNPAALEPIRRFDSHPALWAWYTIDEPDLNRVPPGRVAEMNRLVRAAAKRPTALVLMSGSATATYGDHADIIGVDFYPVPWAPISQFGKEMKLARYALREKPYFAILQAFDWSAFPELIETTQPLRPPSYEELRCMTYMALAHRAKGLFFYSFKTTTWSLVEHDLWRDVKNIVREVNEFLPLFTADFHWWSPDFEYLEGPESMYNEVREGKIILVLLQVSAGSAQVPAGRYVLAINTTEDTVLFRVRLPHEGNSAPVLGGMGTVPLADGTLYRDFAPYEVLIVGPLGSAAR